MPARILHVAEAFGGGLLEMVRLVAEHAADRGHPVAIAHGRRPETPADPRTVVREPVELVALPWEDRSPRSQLATARSLRSLAGGWRPDVVHLHSSFAGVVGAVSIPLGTPVVFTPHAFASSLAELPSSRRRAYALLERIAVRRATVVGAVSASEARAATALGGRDVRILENGIPELDDAPAGGPPPREGRPRAIAMGRIVRQRRPEACARILGAVADVADVAWVGGGGDEEGPWGVGAREALRTAGVELTGWVDRPRAVAELEAADLYLHWTAWDGQPLSVLEAMARDAVVVASDIEPNRELLGVRQVCATEADAVALLRRLAVDRALRAELLASQRERRARWSARAMCERWLRVYAELG